MKTTYKLPRLTLSKDDCNASLCILSNNLGGFLFLSDPPISKFNGFFYNDDLDVYKIIENIRLVDSSFNEIEDNLWYLKRKHPGNTEKIFCPKGVNGIVYSLAKKSRIGIDFDCRKVNDMRQFGRFYEVAQEKKSIILSFVKKTDEREDDNQGAEEFSLFIAIQPKSFDASKDYEHVDTWEEHFYEYDNERKDLPLNRYVYRPIILNAKELLIAAGKTKEDALSELIKLRKAKPSKHDYKTLDKKKNLEAAAAFMCAQDSLEKLKTKYEGITRLYAGFPWFFQFWSRDENISLGALIKLHQFKIVKDLLFKYLKSIGNDGRLANRIPSSHLASADSIGWFWKRMGDFIEELKARHLLEKHLSSKEMEEVKAALAESIKRIEKNYKSDSLITNKKDETWMDTDMDNQDPRDGARIEVQALHLNMLRLMSELSNEKKYKNRENKMKKAVIERFWNGETLADGDGDFTARPNVFIAHYVYPDLLSRPEWQTCFENILKKLWLDWGGLASIDPKHRLFVPDYTGIDNKSYHRGDSWFWINNLAALCMFRNNPIYFEEKILKIIESSTKELLWHGAVGHAAEISSASHLSSKGCFAQAWSAAMFIELLMEVYK